MINRYEVKEISEIWSEKQKFYHYLKTEIAHLNTLEEANVAPHGQSKKIKNANINVDRISELEKVTNHDVIAFCTSITEQFPSDVGRFFHFGITSSDIIDTAHALMIKDSISIILSDMDELKKILRQRANETSELLCIGRSHGISAEAMIFGQKFLSYEAELSRRMKDWEELKNNLTGQFSGAVGNYTVVSPEFEDKTLSKLGLKVEAVSSQVIPRDHYAKIISVGSLIASLYERMATEFRLLQHSDIDEIKEGFSKGQKGSSTMPHKKNPISSENISGLTRVIRSHLTPALENCALWHERDISHSSVERMMLPDHFGLLAYTTRRMKSLVENLVLDENKIESKVLANEKIFSSFVLHQLILKNEKVRREELYEIVQNAFFQSKSLNDLMKNLTNDLEDKNLNHNTKEWLKIENLRSHYVQQFKKILNRLA